MAIDDQVSDSTHPRRGMSWLKAIGLTVVILVIVVAGGLMWNQHTSASKLQNMLAEMDRNEPGWRFEDIEAARPEIPDEQNSAAVIDAAVQLMPKQWPSADFPNDQLRRRTSAEMLSGEEFTRLTRELASVRPALSMALKLSDLPRGRNRIQHARNPLATLLPHAQHSRTIVSLLNYESMRQNQRGDSKKALLAVVAALNAARSVGDEPFYISQLVRTAGVALVCQAIERILGQGEPSSEDLAEMQKWLADEDAFSDLLTASLGERAMMHALFEAVARGEVSIDELAQSRSGRLESTAISLWRMNTREDQALSLSFMTRRIKEVQQPMHEQAALEKRFEQDVRELPRNAFITRTLLPAVAKMGEASRRKHAMMCCTIIALAAERYRRDKKVWPDNLEQLRPQHLAAEMLDPFDGKPLRYRRVEDGVIVYSVGADGVDNGGNLDRERPAMPGVDIGVRLWDVAKRRQPAQPKPADNPGPRAPGADMPR